MQSTKYAPNTNFSHISGSAGGVCSPMYQGENVAPRVGVRGAERPLPPPEGEALLGIYAVNYSTPVTARVSADGEILDAPRDSRTARAERFVLKAAARRLLPKDHRTSKCMHWGLPNMEKQVLKGATKGKAFFHGLQVCSMPWTCPVCATKISERRRQEASKGMQQADLLGLKARLVTLTAPHGLGDDLLQISNMQTKAWTSLWQGRRGVELRNSLGLFGHIRALEVTYGKNGFHPHFHVLMFYHPDQTNDDAWAKLPFAWQKAAVRAGLPLPSIERGCQVDDGSKAAKYVAKGVWGLESEVTKGHIKKGKRDSLTPFDLLRRYANGDKQAGALWRVYVDAFQGKRQLFWSVGLKKLLAIAELSDEEITNKPEEEPALLLATITDDQWRVIYRRHLESTVLDLAEVSPDALRLFLRSVRDS